MKRPAIIFALAVLTLAMFAPFIQSACAQTSSYSIQTVDHTVNVLNSGNLVVTDKIQVSGQLPSSFLMGFPYMYGSEILKAVAYDSNNNTLPVTLGVQLQSESGFYGLSVSLPSGTSQTFTVVTTFSNNLVASTQTTNGFTVNFPAYPSFTTSTAQINGNLKLPDQSANVIIDKNGQIINGSTTYSDSNLAAFDYTPATANFTCPTGNPQLIAFTSLNRQISINPSGAVTCTDTYRVMDEFTSSVAAISISLPVGATNIVARDEFGRVLSSTLIESTTLTMVANVSLADLSMSPGDTSTLTIDYSLPSISQVSSGKFEADLDLFPYFNYYVESVSVTVSPPEGARITSPQMSSVGGSADVSRDVFGQFCTSSSRHQPSFACCLRLQFLVDCFPPDFVDVGYRDCGLRDWGLVG